MEPTSAPESTNDVPKITIVYDNTVHDERLSADWGFAALIELADQTILFDTGGSGSILVRNMMELDIDPADIDAIVLSHEHADHTGGLALLLAQGIEPTMYLPSSFTSSMKSFAGSHGQLVEVTEPAEIYPGVFTTGEIGDEILEQALLLDTPDGLVVITGCAHPGIVEILHRVNEISDRDIDMVVGGFHLGSHSESQIVAIIDEFQNLGVKRVIPAHCTGELAQSLFAEAYGDKYSIGGAGRVLSDSP
jgi:7,8-dihydropterin-6-yl-methyl-4-(beta-D-ribofuranosyl)aminobenzene 5'-phosphate synthase